MNMQDKEQRAQLKKICPAALNYIERLEAERDEIAQQLDYCFKVELADARARSEAYEKTGASPEWLKQAVQLHQEGRLIRLEKGQYVHIDPPEIDIARFSDKPTPCQEGE